MDIDFNYEEFYNSVVDYFEVTAAEAVIDELLVWWDKCVCCICTLLYIANHGPTRKVFGHTKYGALYLTIPHSNTSVAYL